jgi:hypothetical protein
MDSIVISLQDEKTGHVLTCVSKPLHRVTDEWLGREVREMATEATGLKQPHRVTVRVAARATRRSRR